jgi:hypothetical protein
VRAGAASSIRVKVRLTSSRLVSRTSTDRSLASAADRDAQIMTFSQPRPTLAQPLKKLEGGGLEPVTGRTIRF